jgi:hypothetical protein
MNVDTSKWSGEGEFTQLLLEHLRQVREVVAIRVEDAPATRSEADYNFISNELFINFANETHEERTRRWGFVPVRQIVETKAMTIAQLEVALSADAAIGPPDYSDGGMLQYLRAERIIPPYQTRGYKLVEMVRIYEAGRVAQ